MIFLFEKSSGYKTIREARTAADEYFGKNNVNKYATYGKLDTNDRAKYIQWVVDNLANAKQLKSIKGNIINSILENGWDSPITKYIERIDFNIDQSTFNLVDTLIKNGSLSADRKWLYDPQVYNRSVQDTDYTIKVLTLASNEKLQKDEVGSNKFSDKALNPTYFYIRDKLMNVAQIKDKLNKWQTKKVLTPSKDGITGQNILKSVLRTNAYKFDDILNYIINSDAIVGDRRLGNETAIRNYLASDEGKKKLKNVLQKSYKKDTTLGDDVSETNMLNKEFKSVVDDFLNKSKETKLDKKPASRVLIDNGIRTFETLKKLAVQSAYPGENQETKREMFRNYLDTNEGKKKLNKILQTNYSDTFIETSLEQIKDDLAELAQNVDIVGNR